MRVAHLRNELREEKVRRFGLRLRVGFQLFIALVATVIGIGVAIMIRDAFTSRRVVIEPFDAPPALAARGLTGKVVAGGLLTNSGVCRMRPAVPPLPVTFPAPGRTTSSSTCRRPACPSARSRVCSRSDSGMTRPSMATWSRPLGRLGAHGSRQRGAAKDLQWVRDGTREAHGRGCRVRLLEVSACTVGGVFDRGGPQ